MPANHFLQYAFLVFSSGFVFLSGCNPHVINEKPLPSVSVDGRFDTTSRLSSVSSNEWWKDFNRPTINRLVEQAFANNQSIVQAIAQVQQAQALITQTRSNRRPQIDLEANVRDRWEGRDEQRLEGDMGAALRWELDMFDRIGSAMRADQYELLARKELLDAVKLTLSAEVVNTYFAAVSSLKTLELLNKQAQLDRTLLELLQLRFDSGIGTVVDVLQQQSRVADSESLIPSVEAELHVFENRLDVLLGELADGDNRILSDEALSFNEILPALGVHADLILNRPDLRALRAELVAADADIGAAIADRLPRIVLNGTYTYTNSSDFDGPLAMIMGTFVQPLLDWGKRKAIVAQNRALYEERMAIYTQRFLEAVEQVENALYQENRQREFIHRLKLRRDLLQTTVYETEARYKQGIDDYLPVINALQELRVVERSLIDESRTLVEYRIQLHRAIGGRIVAKRDEVQS